MSLGSLAVGLSLALAIKMRTCPGTPSTFGRWEELPTGVIEEEEEEMDATENDDADRANIELNATFTWPSRLVWHVAG